MSIQLSPDTISHIVKRSTDVLLLQSPLHTILGGISGAVGHEFLSALEPTEGLLLTLVGINQWYYIALGVLLFNLTRLLRPKPKLPPDIETAIYFLEVAKRRGDIPPEQMRVMYIKLYARILEQVTLDAETTAQVKRLEESVKE